mgnify:CR=1 FL=1
MSQKLTQITRYAGLIAEDVEQAGLTEFVTYGTDGQIESIAYDRLWIHLIPVIKKLLNRVEELENERTTD